MKIRSSTLFCLLTLNFFLPVILSAQVFVDISASGNNDGSSWVNAYTDLNVALSNTASGEIWVSNGSYKPIVCNPCNDSDRLTSFNIPPAVQLYGGFEGIETQLSERDWATNLTILSGDIGVANDSTDNSFRVVSVENSLSTTILDGFIIEEGNADGSSINGTFFSGGGIYIDANPGGTGNIQIRNCIFRNNFAGGGGAMAIDCVIGGVCEALIQNCVFEGNTASTGNVSSTGAGILMLGNSGAQISPRIIECTFNNNFVGNDGGAISMTPSGNTSLLAPLIERCTFTNNGSADRGAGIWYRMIQGTSNVMIKDCYFSENIAGGQGGAVYARASFDAVANDTLLNCVFSKNRSEGTSTVNDGEGGAVFLRGSQTGTRNQQVLNCVFDKNFASHRGGAIGTTSFFDTPSDTIGIINSNVVNCSFYGNTTDGDGGAVHANGTQGFNNMVLSNSIFWSDTAAVSGMELFHVNSNLTISYSDIAGGVPIGVNDGGNNLDTLPYYNDPVNGDLRIGGCSPLVNAGNNAEVLAAQDPDPDGDSRIWEGVVDIGAYEVGIIYVDLNATGLNNGTSWNNAFNDLQDGINRAFGGDQVWVAQGIYSPTNCLPCLDSDRLISFYIKSGTELYGGFNGSETNLSQRNWDSNLTILSGDIGVPIDSTDNSFRVITAENTSEKTVFDGFIIEEGNADGSSINGTFFSGGGMYIDANPSGIGNLKIRNTTFRNNFAGGGGAVAIDAVIGGTIEAEFRNCIFEGNTASTGNVSSTGAGILMLGNSGAQIRPRIIGCTFQNNFVGNDGGGISMTPSGETSVLATVIDSCTFINNRSSDRGAAIWYRMIQGSSNVIIKNSSFENNTAGGQGGAVYARASFSAIANDTLINCLFSHNTSDGTSSVNDGEGGAVFLRGSQEASRNHEIINCVFDQNYASHRGGAVGTTSFFDTPSDTIGIINSNFVNCTFYGNTTDGDGGALHANGVQGTNTMTFSNSIFWKDSSATIANEFFNNGATVSLSYCNIDGGVPAGLTDGGNNLNVDPQFLDPENGDLHLSSCSPSRNTGLNSAVPLDLVDIDGDGNMVEPIDIDLDGLPRVFDTTIDMGAYEWNGTPELMVIELDSTNVTCNGFCDGSASINVSGGVPGYDVSWSNGEVTTTVLGLCPGTYTVTVTDAFSCVLMDSITIVENDVVSVLVNSDTTVCLGESVELFATGSGGTGDFNYEWDNSLGLGPTHLINPDASTSYSVTITDDNGCTATEEVIVTVIETNPQISGQLSICTGTSTELDAGLYESYSWTSGDTTQIITVTSGGIYSVTVSDANGCTGSTEAEVIENENLSPQISGQLSICTGTSTELDAGLYESYSWTSGDTTQTITVTTGGIYSVTVTDTNGCTGETEAEVIENENLSPQISGQLSICTGTSTELDAGLYESYSWTSGDTTQTIIVTSGGIYSVTVSDTNGCTGETEVEVIENENLSPQISGQLSICTGTSTELDAGLYESYSWTSGDTTQTITVTSGGIYSVTVSDTNGCTGETEAEVIENENLSPQISGQLSICTGTSTELDAGLYESYSWTSGDTTQTITVTSGGVYSVTVSDTNGCTGEAEAEVIENDNLSPEITGQLSICTGTSTELDAGLYESYSWTSGDTTQTITVTSGGVYSVTVSDTNGCTGETEAEVIENDNLSPEITGQLSICTGTSTELDAGLYESYSWTSGDTTQTITVTSGGIYSVTVSDTNGCTGSTEVEVIENDNLSPEITGQLSICTGTSTELDAGLYESYSWASGDTTQTITVTTGGLYSVTVSDANGCTGSTEVEVIENDNLSPEITGQLSICTGTSTELDAGLYESYSWASGDTTQTIIVTSGGIYSVTVSDTNGCTGETEVEVIENENLSPQISGQLSICTGTSTELDAGIYDSYQWSNGEEAQTITVSTAGLYGVTVTDASGCTGEDEVIVSFDQGVTTMENVELCYGGEYLGNTYFQDTDIVDEQTGANGCDSTHITHLDVFTEIVLELNIEDDCVFEGATVIASSTGGNNIYNYEWSNGENGPIQSGILEGTISVTVTDGLGCTQTGSIFVDPLATLSYEYDIDHVSCFGETDGEINLTITGGLPPFQVEWSDGSTSEDLDNLDPGNYTVFVTDGNGCLVASTIAVFEPDSLQIEVETTPSTMGDNGTATAFASGGTTPYTYQWSNGSNEVMIENLSPGLYSLTISDANGCITETVIQISNTTSVLNHNLLLSFNLYPNPGDGLFYLELELNETKAIHVQVADALGREIIDLGKFYNNIFVIPVHMADFSGGNYFLIIDVGDEKLIKHFLLNR